MGDTSLRDELGATTSNQHTGLSSLSTDLLDMLLDTMHEAREIKALVHLSGTCRALRLRLRSELTPHRNLTLNARAEQNRIGIGRIPPRDLCARLEWAAQISRIHERIQDTRSQLLAVSESTRAQRHMEMHVETPSRATLLPRMVHVPLWDMQQATDDLC